MRHTPNRRLGRGTLLVTAALAACAGGPDAAPGGEARGGSGADAPASGGAAGSPGAGTSGSGAGSAAAGGGGNAGGPPSGAGSGGTEAGGDGGAGGASAGGGAGGMGGGGSGGGPPGSYLLHAHFTSAPLGKYERGNVQADFGVAAPWDNGLSAGRASIVQEGNDKFLRVTYPNAVYGPADGGVQFVVALGERYEELYFAYRVRFQAGFGFNMGGKLPGLVGGSSPTGCKPDEGGFSARNMWRSGGAIVQYVYWPDQPNTCGDDRYYRTNGDDVVFAPGTWMTVEHHVKMNTVGANDGVLEGWVDGVRYLNETTRQWRKTNTFAIDALYFSTFFGGGSQPWASPKEQHADFDDLIVSEAPIAH